MAFNPFNLQQDASALNALCLHMSSFTNRLNETGQNLSCQTIYHYLSLLRSKPQASTIDCCFSKEFLQGMHLLNLCKQ